VGNMDRGETDRQCTDEIRDGEAVGGTVGSARPYVDRLVPLVVLLVYAIFCVTLLAEEQWRAEWDSATYILTGRAIAAGEGYSYLGRPFFLRPPGLSWLISIIHGDGPFDPKRLNLMVMLFAAVTPGAIYFALARQTGRWTALAVAMLSGTSAVFVRNFNSVQSEFPFMALFFAGIGLLQISSDRKAGWWAASLAGAACVAGAFYMRSVALLLIPGMLFVGWRHDKGTQRWRALLPFVVAIALAMPWIVHQKKAAAAAAKPSEQELLFDYWTAMFHVSPGDPASDMVNIDGWRRRIRKNSSGAISHLGQHTLATRKAWAGLFLVALALAGMFLTIYRRASILEWFAVAYTALVLTYFTFDVRLLVPLVPLLYLYALEVVSEVGNLASERLNRPRAPVILGTTAFVALMTINLWLLPQVISAQRKSPYNYRMRNVAAWIRRQTPPDAVILCGSAPIVNLLTNRVAYSYHFYRTGNLLQKYEPDYVIFDFLIPSESFVQDVAKNSSDQWVQTGERDNWTVRIYKMKKPLDAPNQHGENLGQIPY